jgi:tRNA A37 N6-isopentenylltransferase MiaA
MSRRRFTIDDARWSRALEYAEATNRTPSELVCEALDQIQARYPKRRHATETDVDVLAGKVAGLLGLRVPAGTLSVKS